jgi:hypothetical protein
LHGPAGRCGLDRASGIRVGQEPDVPAGRGGGGSSAVLARSGAMHARARCDQYVVTVAPLTCAGVFADVGDLAPSVAAAGSRVIGDCVAFRIGHGLDEFVGHDLGGGGEAS